MPTVEPPAELPPDAAFPPFNAMRAFDAVARLGGVRRAADALGVHHSAISRHLKAIEQWTGATLIARTGRWVSLTEDGWRYHAKLAIAMDALAQATLEFAKTRRQAKLVIWSRAGIAVEWLMPRLDELRAAVPNMQLELKPSYFPPDFIRDRADIFVQYMSSYDAEIPLSADLVSIEFVRSPIIPVASPHYLSSKPRIRTPQDIFDHQLIEDEGDEGWRHWFACYDVDRGRKALGPRFWQPHHALDAARQGHGIALSTAFLAKADLDAGRLTEVVGEAGRFPPGLIGSYRLLGRRDGWDEGARRGVREWILSAVGKAWEPDA